MKIIISPAKKMCVDPDTFDVESTPQMIKQTSEIVKYLKSQTSAELAKIWRTSDRLFQMNIERLKNLDLNNPIQTPAILAFCGLQYQYMAPDLFTETGLKYLQQNVRILSSLYGVLRPFDGVVPYRLEMKAKVHVNGTRNLHDFWNRTWYDNLTQDDDLIINLASHMYANQVGKYLTEDVRIISCVFGYFDEQKQKVISDNTYAKMARGEMVRFLSENNIQDYHQMTEFNDFGYHYRAEYSDAKTFVFLRKPKRKGLNNENYNA